MKRDTVKAYDVIHNFLMIKNLTDCSLEKVVAYISSVYNVSYDDLFTWASDKQKEMIRNIAEATPYQKIEIEFAEETEDQKNFNIAVDESNNLYRRADSIKLMKDRNLLVKLYTEIDDSFLKKEIVKVCNLDEIYDMALKEKDESLMIEVVRSIHNRMKLRWAAETCDSDAVRIEAIKKISDIHTLQKIIMQDNNEDVKKAAVNQIKSITALESLQESIPKKYSGYVTDRIALLNGSEDYIKQSIENLIQTYH